MDCEVTAGCRFGKGNSNFYDRQGQRGAWLETETQMQRQTDRQTDRQSRHIQKKKKKVMIEKAEEKDKKRSHDKTCIMIVSVFHLDLIS